jgi:hypothetical protein
MKQRVKIEQDKILNYSKGNNGYWEYRGNTDGKTILSYIPGIPRIADTYPVRNMIFILGLILILIQCSSPSEKKPDRETLGSLLPRVLFITTGISDEGSQLAQGIVIAIQSFNKSGAVVRLEPRDILYHFKDLKKFNIIILSAFPGYHDADRKYSLSYMSDEELHNLTKFVAEGGVLISGENVGRNYPDGTDRVSIFQILTPDNWELSKCYGASFSEKNMTGFGLEGKIADLPWDIPADLLSDDEHELWTLVPDAMATGNYKTMGYWNNRGNSTPAIIENKYENGFAYFLAFSGLLHPKNEGGYWSEDQIDKFYKFVIDTYNDTHGIKFSLNPWPGGYDYAFCISLNAEGAIGQYERVLHLLENENIEPTIFVNGLVSAELKDYLKKKSFPLASNGYSYSNFDDLKYPQAVDDILRNENYWDLDFQGFRFPFTNPGFWGLLALDEHKYKFESSVGANNLDFFHGSVVPYNIVMADNGYYKSTDILEIAPTYHDDYHFLKIIKDDHSPDSSQVGKNVMVYRKYLENFWNYAVKPYRGCMVFLGHPQFVGYCDTTLSALEGIIHTVKNENTWITTINEVAEFRKNLALLQFYVNGDKQKQQISIAAPENLIVSDVCLNFKDRIKNGSAEKGKVKIVQNSNGSQIIFDAFNGQTITIQY